MDSDVFDRLLSISDLLHRDMARAFAGTPLTESRVAVLWTIATRGPSTQRDIARELRVSAKNVSLLVDALAAADYVRRTPHPDDRRAVLVDLTDSASELMAGMQREHADLARTLVAAVAPDDRAAVRRGIAAIDDRLRELVEEAEAGAPEPAPAPRGGAA